METTTQQIDLFFVEYDNLTLMMSTGLSRLRLYIYNRKHALETSGMESERCFARQGRSNEIPFQVASWEL